MALTDDELIKLAKQVTESEQDLHDVWYYQQQYSIVDGVDPLYSNHLFYHYKNWSIDPVDFFTFLECLKLQNKNTKRIFFDKHKCILNMENLIGEYVKNQKKIQKEKRSRKISSIKSKT